MSSQPDGASLPELDAARRTNAPSPEAEAKVAEALGAASERIEALAARIESGG